ncbi:nucleopolyhedrovirus p10 family protein [Gigaspora margarita]|uniref:Nucleopolyhedrovirus p10 family protein n=1 Tax=Gigaspora margarita TaxID=4874 RepID=A0A8H4ELA8_GIGMA|nr:nucleopolyhedrovirus p10 family protein [Gigaspora margarita]
MTSKLDNSHLKIPIEEASDKNKILKIVCSPNIKYVATLNENSSISLWSIVNQEKYLLYIKTIYPDNIKIINFETEKEVSLTLPYWQNEINFLSFINNGNIIMVNTEYYRAYVFTSKEKNIRWVCKSIIELKYFKKIYITLKGKLIIFNDTIYEITMWNIEELSVNTRILIDWDQTLKSIEISDDEKLLLVCAKNEKTKETRLYVFSTETSVTVRKLTTKMVINRFHLIASQKGERFLYIGNNQYNLVDPYKFKNPIDASKLFESKQIQEPYIIRSDKIIYTIDGKMFIEELVPDNWVDYLRKELKDTNSITTPPKKTIDIIIKILKNGLTNDYNAGGKEFKGKFLKWGLELDDKSVILTVIDFNYHMNKWNLDDEKKQLDILPSLKNINGKDFILHCEALENDDFITITRIGVIIWTYERYSIKMHYYWNHRLENFNFEKTNFKELLGLFKEWTPGRIFPASSYEIIYKNLDVKFGEKEGEKEGKELFKEFLEDTIVEEFNLVCYGKILMKTFIKLKEDKWILSLYSSCRDKCVQDNNHLISKISLMSIIFENFEELSENNPVIIANVLSFLEFVIPSIINPNSMSLHRSSYGRYCHLSKSTFLDVLISEFLVRFQRFQIRFHLNFRDLEPAINNYQVNQSSTILAIPLPGFASYPKKYNFWKELLLPSPNTFIYSIRSTMINEEFYNHLNLEALLKFKWNTYGRKY